jgi:hypothetical protein
VVCVGGIGLGSGYLQVSRLFAYVRPCQYSDFLSFTTIRPGLSIAIVLGSVFVQMSVSEDVRKECTVACREDYVVRSECFNACIIGPGFTRTGMNLGMGGDLIFRKISKSIVANARICRLKRSIEHTEVR